MKITHTTNWAVLLIDLVIIAVAVFLTIHFENGSWMWFAALIFVTGAPRNRNKEGTPKELQED